MKQLSFLLSLALVMCATRQGEVRIRESLEVVEMTPASLPSDPARAPSATRVTVLYTGGEQVQIQPGTIFLQQPSIVAFRKQGSREFQLPLDDIRAIHFEQFNSRELSRDISSSVDMNPLAIAFFILVPIGGVALLVGLARQNKL